MFERSVPKVLSSVLPVQLEQEKGNNFLGRELNFDVHYVMGVAVTSINQNTFILFDKFVIETMGVFFCNSLDICYDPCHVYT